MREDMKNEGELSEVLTAGGGCFDFLEPITPEEFDDLLEDMSEHLAEVLPKFTAPEEFHDSIRPKSGQNDAQRHTIDLGTGAGKSVIHNEFCRQRKREEKFDHVTQDKSQWKSSEPVQLSCIPSQHPSQPQWIPSTDLRNIYSPLLISSADLFSSAYRPLPSSEFTSMDVQPTHSDSIEAHETPDEWILDPLLFQVSPSPLGAAPDESCFSEFFEVCPSSFAATRTPPSMSSHPEDTTAQSHDCASTSMDGPATPLSYPGSPPSPPQPPPPSPPPLPLSPPAAVATTSLRAAAVMADDQFGKIPIMCHSAAELTDEETNSLNSISNASKLPTYLPSCTTRSYSNSEVDGVDFDRRERRKEQNRRAARRCRHRKKEQYNQLTQAIKSLEAEKSQFSKEIILLQKVLTELGGAMADHRRHCDYLPDDLTI